MTTSRPFDIAASEQPYTPEPEQISEALNLIREYGGIDGDHHKLWVLDQVVRQLTGDRYEEFVARSRDGEDGPETYSWDDGIPP